MRGLAQGSINELFKTQLLTVTKLFFIMGKLEKKDYEFFNFLKIFLFQEFPGHLMWYLLLWDMLMAKVAVIPTQSE